MKRLVVAAAFAAAASAAADTSLAWRQEGGPGEGSVRVLGLDRHAADTLAVALDAGLGARLLRVVAVPSKAPPSRESVPNLWGTWSIEGSDLVFRPRHAVAPGLEIEAHFDGPTFDAATGSTGARSLAIRHLVAESPGPHPRVVRIAPSSPTVPANLLRIYIEFSQPMSARDVERQVGLSADGGPVDLAFVDVRNGLWDPERKRLTLFIHPGRVKTGVAVNEALGPVLREGAEIVVTVGAGARDADGRTLERPFEHRWRVGPPRRQGLDPAQWTLHAPETPRGELILNFPFALDRGLLARALTVLTSDGAVDGTWTVGEEERSVRFRPNAAWVAGITYRVAIDPVLEDPTGQRIGRAFERRATDSATASAESAGAAALDFTVAF